MFSRSGSTFYINGINYIIKQLSDNFTCSDCSFFARNVFPLNIGSWSNPKLFSTRFFRHLLQYFPNQLCIKFEIDKFRASLPNFLFHCCSVKDYFLQIYRGVRCLVGKPVQRASLILSSHIFLCHFVHF